jgi:hypothetical protein
MDRPNDMRHVRSADDLRKTLETADWPRGIYGDTIGGKSFTDAESDILLKAQSHNRPEAACGWREVWHNLACWTIIDCSPETEERETRLSIESEIRAGRG